MAGIESHLRSFNTGVICSYFLVPVRILAAKFWIFCNFRTSVLLVLAQTVEQKYSLLLVSSGVKKMLNPVNFGVSLEDVRSYCLFGRIQNSLNDEITVGVIYFT